MEVVSTYSLHEVLVLVLETLEARLQLIDAVEAFVLTTGVLNDGLEEVREDLVLLVVHLLLLKGTLLIHELSPQLLDLLLLVFDFELLALQLVSFSLTLCAVVR